IDDDEVTLSFEGKQIVLAAPAHSGNHRHNHDVPVRAPSAADAKQVDLVGSEPAPIDPYDSGDRPIRVGLSPGAPGAVEPGHAPRVIEAGEGGVRVAEAPTGAPSATGASSTSGAPNAGASSAPNAPTAASASSAPTAPDAQTSDARAADATAAQGGI